jgi:hypothetical protein
VTDTTVLLIVFLLFVGVPAIVITKIAYWYGGRHGWDVRQYAWVELGGAIAVFVVLVGGIMRDPIDRVLKIAAIVGLAGTIGILIGKRIAYGRGQSK